MSTPSIAVDANPAPHADARLLRRLSALAIWLPTSAIAVFFSLIVRDSTIIGDMYLPRGNDSFYHARRILDAAIGTRGFYEFDDRLHVPDGSWISWPWAYDYLMAKATQVALWLYPGLDPMAFISYVPVAWILVNAALFLAAASALGLAREMRLIAMLCFALSPLTQLLHSIGMVDHHYVEHTFVLLTLWLGLRWFAAPEKSRAAMWLGIALGIAPAFHDGLFILQLVPLGCLFVLWLRGNLPPRRALLAFAIALLVATQLVLLPSLPYQKGMFEFGLLSWFHFYVAVCTAAATVYLSYFPFSRRNLLLLGGLCAVLAAPLSLQAIGGAHFLAGDFSLLDLVTEVQSPYRLFTQLWSPIETLSYYSCLLFLAPVLLAFYAYRIFRERDPTYLYYAIAVVFGLAMLLDQLRLEYYGFFGLVTGGLMIVDALRRRHSWHRGAVFVATLAAMVAAYQPPLRHRLFGVYAPGADANYASAFGLFLELNRLCAADPGVVLADTNDGNPILFHSDCSVIANNFILRPDDAEHIAELLRLMRLTPEQIRRERPDVKYLLLRTLDFAVLREDAVPLTANSAIVQELLTDREPPAGFTLVKTVRLKADETSSVFARLYKVSATQP